MKHIRLNAAAVADALRTAKKGTAAGLSGATVDHYKILLADEATLALFAEAATKLANADVPEPIQPLFSDSGSLVFDSGSLVFLACNCVLLLLVTE